MSPWHRVALVTYEPVFALVKGHDRVSGTHTMRHAARAARLRHPAVAPSVTVLSRSPNGGTDREEQSLMLAYDYPLLGVFWSILLVAMWALWIFVVIWVFIDNFRRTDHHGWAKALWALFIIFVPIIGVFAYIITRPVDPYVVVTDV